MDIDTSILPLEIRTKLAELKFELSEGDITEKGYLKKKAHLLEPYFPTQNNHFRCRNSQIGTREGIVHEEHHYQSELRENAVMHALARHREENAKLARVSMPVKRRAVIPFANSNDGDIQTVEQTKPSYHSMKIGSGNCEITTQIMSNVHRVPLTSTQSTCVTSSPVQEVSKHSNQQHVATEAEVNQRGVEESNSLGTTSAFHVAVDNKRVVDNAGRCPRSPVSARTSLVVQQPTAYQKMEVFAQSEASNSTLVNNCTATCNQSGRTRDSRFDASALHEQSSSCAPDVTTHTKMLKQIDDLAIRDKKSQSPHVISSHAQSVRIPHSRASIVSAENAMKSETTQLQRFANSRTSAKIQQLVNTLAKPKQRSILEMYQDTEDHFLEKIVIDPNAPRPEGQLTLPVESDIFQMPSGSPLNLEAALLRYGVSSYKASAMSWLDDEGRLVDSLSYTKLESLVRKVAFHLLNKLGHRGEASVKPRDRVALAFPNNDPVGFASSFLGCLQAGVIPVPIEVPLPDGDSCTTSMGFLLLSLDVRVVLSCEQCCKNLPRGQGGEIICFPGWPKVQWFSMDTLGKSPRNWQAPPRPDDSETAYIEYTFGADGSIRGVQVSRAALLAHCRTLSSACAYSEGEVAVCVLDFKREQGLWHGLFTAIFNGMHVIFIPYSLMKLDPCSWMKMVTKYRASTALIKSRDLHWALLAQKDITEISLGSLRMLLVADGSNPWSLTSCDAFLNVFQACGLRPEAICPSAASSESLTVSLRRPGHRGYSSLGRAVLSMHALSYGVLRVESENSYTSLTAQDCGQLLPGSRMVVAKISASTTAAATTDSSFSNPSSRNAINGGGVDGSLELCRSDEIGELCVSTAYSGDSYWGLVGLSRSTFGLSVAGEGQLYTNSSVGGFVRTGLLGFLGPASSGNLVFVCGSMDGLIVVNGRRHNMDDIIATVLAVEPMKFIYRGRIALFSQFILRDERIVIVAEQRPNVTEEESFQWMSHVLQAVDTIHQVAVYCLALVQPDSLPRTPLGGIHIHETRRGFEDGNLHPVNVLMCPHTCFTNLPKPRDLSASASAVGPSAIMVGSIVQGHRLADASGRDLGGLADEEESRCRFHFLSEVLQWRAQNTPEHRLFTTLNAKLQEIQVLSCSGLHKRAEKIACLLLERAHLSPGAHVALLYPPGVELVAAVFGCLYAGCVPIAVRPPHASNLTTSLSTCKMVLDCAHAVVLLTMPAVIKLLRSREAVAIVDPSCWPTILDSEDSYRKRLGGVYTPHSADELAYVDFSVSTMGLLTGVRMSHAAASGLCRAIKLQCELYPAREVGLCLDPYSGLGFVLWCLSSVYTGHHSLLMAPTELETNTAAWLTLLAARKLRDCFCSYSVLELSTRLLASQVSSLRAKGVQLSCVRTCVVVAEERPRIQLLSSFSKLFASLGLSPRAVSSSFGCRVNPAVCLQGTTSPDTTQVFVDARALRNDRIVLVERGAPFSICLLETGKLLPGVRVVIANPETRGQCADSHLGEIWVNSSHCADGYYNVYGDNSALCNNGEDSGNIALRNAHFNVRLVTGETTTQFCRTGYLGFVRRTELTQSDGERHDALFVVGALDEAIVLHGMRYHPIDIESSVLRCCRKICECAVFTWRALLVVVVELAGLESEALDLVPLVTNVVVEEHHLIVGVVVVVDPGVVPINSRGEKQRIHLRDGFLDDKLDPIYVAYNL